MTPQVLDIGAPVHAGLTFPLCGAILHISKKNIVLAHHFGNNNAFGKHTKQRNTCARLWDFASKCVPPGCKKRTLAKKEVLGTYLDHRPPQPPFRHNLCTMFKVISKKLWHLPSLSIQLCGCCLRCVLLHISSPFWRGGEHAASCSICFDGKSTVASQQTT